MTPREMARQRIALVACALWYAEQGWPVFPCYELDDAGRCACGQRECDSPGKHPRTEHGFQDAVTDEATIRAWWAQWPDANLAIRTGAQSFWVVDVDPAKGGDESLAALVRQHGPLPSTIEACTGGGGRHLCFASPPGVRVPNRVGTLGPGLDVRGDDGYIVVAPSGHVSGCPYEWEVEHHPDEVSLAPAPQWLVQLVTSSRDNRAGPAPPVDEVIPTGQRNAVLTSLAGTMRRRGMSADEILHALEGVNARRCIPPLSHDELQQIAGSVGRYPPADDAMPGPSAVNAEPPPDAAGRESGDHPRPRPTISVAHLDLQPLRRACWELLVRANDPPTLFSTGVRLARVRPVSGVGRFILEEHGVPSFQACLADIAQFEDQRRRLVAPPLPLVTTMLAEVAPPVPALSRIVSAPLLAPDGALLTTQGYHSATRTFYAPTPGLVLPPVPAAPSLAELEVARVSWLELVRDFPFATSSDRTHALCAGLLPFGRDAIDGPTPIHLFEAPTWGSGKSLLATSVFFPFLGELDSVQPEPESSAEWRKRLLTLLREGAAVAIIDNALDELVAGPLMSLVTAQSYRDRLLGKNQSGQYENRLILAITGNNPVLSGEALRRTVRIRLRPEVPQPWLRDPKTFTHPDLAGWLRAERARLVWSALVLWRAWFAAGCPATDSATPPLGKFERWRAVLGGVCHTAGLEGFLANQEAFYAETSTVDEMVGAFVATWWEKYASSLVVPVPTLFQLAQSVGLGFEARNHQGEVVRFGKWLGKLRDRLFALSTTRWVRVHRTDSSHAGVSRWQLVVLDPPRKDVSESRDGARGDATGETPRSPMNPTAPAW